MMFKKTNNNAFTVIELVIVILFVGILTAIALPSYTQYVTRSRRAAAEACLANYASYMERFYATNMSYKQTSASVSVRPLPQLDCATSQNTGQYYSYDVDTTTLTDSAYSLVATPLSTQLRNDTKCASLKLAQTGQHTVTGTASSVTDCWAH